MPEVRVLSIIVSISCFLTCILWLKCVFAGDNDRRRHDLFAAAAAVVGVDVNSDLKREPRNDDDSCAPRRFWSSVCVATDRRSNDVVSNLRSNESIGVSECARGSFILNGMSGCHSWLKCRDYVNDIVLIERIGHGAVKQVYKGVWKGHLIVAVSVPHVVDGQIIHWNDFNHGLQMLQKLGPSTHLVQFVGHCNSDPPVIITEYHSYGSADNVQEVFQTLSRDSNNMATRFRFCLNYVEILSWLHASPIGVRVMCDTNDLKKTLEQYLVTNELRLVLNDVDALPEVDRSSERLVKCGHERLYGDYVAPEQLWPYSDREYDDREMNGYDERSDVWKIPDVCSFFLFGTVSEAENVLLSYRLFKIHRECKTVDPKLRPTAKDVLKEYRKIWFELYENKS